MSFKTFVWNIVPHKHDKKVVIEGFKKILKYRSYHCSKCGRLVEETNLLHRGQNG